MKNMLVVEGIIIVLLIVIICVIPNNSLSELEESSLKTEHVGHMNLASGNESGTSGNQNQNVSNPGETEDATEKTLVSISRPKGGFSAYENGTFVEPEPETVVDVPDDGNSGNEDDGTGTDDADGTDGSSGDSSDSSEDGSGQTGDTGETDSEEDKEDNSSSGDFDWPMKDPTTAIDTGKRATTTAPIKLRTTPTIQTEDNVITTLSEGEVLVVTDAAVSSTDPDVPNWVEVYYKGQIGYISAKYVSVE